MTSKWFQWIMADPTIVLSLGGAPILSVWLPFQDVSISFNAGDGVFYSTQDVGAEVVPIPPGVTALTLTATLSSQIYVFATSAVFRPFKDRDSA